MGSGKYIQKGKKKKLTIRYDYFETPVKIGDGEYIVTFDVEVFPNVNNYRTHKVINEMDLVPKDSADTGTHPPQGLTGTNPSLEFIISYVGDGVKEEYTQEGAGFSDAFQPALVDDVTADALLRERTSVNFLTRKGGLELKPDMTQVEKRQAVKKAVERIARRRKGKNRGTD